MFLLSNFYLSLPPKKASQHFEGNLKEICISSCGSAELEFLSRALGMPVCVSPKFSFGSWEGPGCIPALLGARAHLPRRWRARGRSEFT